MSATRPRVLFLASNPLRDAPVAVDVEARGILERLGDRDRIELSYVPAPRVTDVLREAERQRPEIVHVTGHGNTKELYFLAEDDTPTTLSVPVLAALMRQLGQDAAKVVVLNYCASLEAARAIVGDPAGAIACAIGTRDAIPDAEAIAFAAAFYGALAMDLSVRRAFEDGRVQVDLVGGSGARIELCVREGVDASALFLRRAEPSPARSTLRAPPADFTGRAKELAEVRGKLGGAGVLISGQGGVGKSALARKLAAELARGYPDAQIDVSLRGSAAPSLAVQSAMAEVIHVFDPSSKLPSGADALAGLYRSTLHGKRALLLFDDATDASQIEALMPPEGTLVLVTAWTWFAAPGIEPYDLGEMTPPDAIALVRRIAPRLREEEAAELASRCGYLPLALRTAAGTLANRRDLKPARYLERLASADERVKLIDEVLHEGASMLDASARDAWTMLGVFVADFDLDAAAAVLGVDRDRAGETLSGILERNLIEWDEATERYHLHDLVREYVRRDLTPDNARIAGLRYVEHFTAVAVSADERVAKGGAAMLEGLAVFDRERRNIAAALAWTMDRREACANIAATLQRILSGAAYSLALRELAVDRVSWFAAAAALAKRAGDRLMTCVLLSNLGTAQLELGEPYAAIAAHEEELAIARELLDKRATANAIGNLGVARWAVGRPEAVPCFEEQLALAREIGDRHIEATALGNLGGVAWRAGDLPAAIARYRERLAIAREIGDKRAEGSALGNLASTLAQTGKIDEAIALYEQRLAIALAIGDRRGEGAALGNLGVVRRDRGELAKAIELLERHLAIAEQLGDPRAEHHALAQLATATASAGDTERSAAFAQRAQLLSHKLNGGPAEPSWNLGDGDLPPQRLLEQTTFGGMRMGDGGPPPPAP